VNVFFACASLDTELATKEEGRGERGETFVRVKPYLYVFPDFLVWVTDELWQGERD
jgi:hypothetical protein